MQLKLDFNICKNPDWIYKEVMAYLKDLKKKKVGSMWFTEIDLKDDWWISRAYDFFQKDKRFDYMDWFRFEEKYRNFDTL